MEPEVITDPRPDATPSAWRTYREALAAAGEERVVILQDDCLPCVGFTRAAERAAELLPDRLVSFFIASHAVVERTEHDKACYHGQPFVELYQHQFRWLPLVATMWPPGMAANFLAWTVMKNIPLNHLADDSVAAAWAKTEIKSFIATVPSLVDHPDDTKTLVSAPRSRTAHCFIGDTPVEEWLALT